MKILFHHRIRSKDGQYVHLAELVAAFRRNGHDVRLVGPRVVDSSPFGADAGYVDRLRTHIPRMVFEWLEIGYSIVALPRLVRAVLADRPDFIYERFNLFYPIGAIVARCLRVPYVLEINGPLFEERSEHGGLALKGLARWSQGFTWRRADVAVPVSEVLAGDLRRYGVRPERIVVMHNGVEPERFAAKTGTAQAKLRWNAGPGVTLGFVGFIRPWHGVDRVIRLLASGRLADDVCLCIAGEGPAVPALRALAHDLGVSDRVHFHGLVEREEIPAFLQAIDVALQPAVTAYASPLKVIEYLAAGKAIVAPDQPNIRELLADGDNAVLFDPTRPDALDEAIVSVCSDASVRQRIAVRARRTIEEKDLTWTGNAGRVVEAVRRLGLRAQA